MIKIRLARIGKKKQPTYRLVVSDNKKDMYGTHLEILGHYNPRTKVTEVKKDRILEWIGKGAKVSDTVHNLLVSQNIISGETKKSYSITKKRQGKIDEKVAEQKAKEEAEAQAKKEAEEAAKAEAEAKAAEEAAAKEEPKEETPAEEKTEEPKAEAEEAATTEATPEEPKEEEKKAE